METDKNSSLQDYKGWVANTVSEMEAVNKVGNTRKIFRRKIFEKEMHTWSGVPDVMTLTLLALSFDNNIFHG